MWYCVVLDLLGREKESGERGGGERGGEVWPLLIRCYLVDLGGHGAVQGSELVLRGGEGGKEEKKC